MNFIHGFLKVINSEVGGAGAAVILIIIVLLAGTYLIITKMES